MKFDRARNLVKLLLVLCVVLCVTGVAMTNTGNAFASYSGIISIVCFVLAFVVVILYCRCPYCGKVIYLGLFKAVSCPHCRRNLTTGAKTKGKGGKR